MDFFSFSFSVLKLLANVYDADAYEADDDFVDFVSLIYNLMPHIASNVDENPAACGVPSGRRQSPGRA
jgi:hypothetical protein